MPKCKYCGEEIIIFEYEKNGQACDICADEHLQYNDLCLIGDNRDQLGRDRMRPSDMEDYRWDDDEDHEEDNEECDDDDSEADNGVNPAF